MTYRQMEKINQQSCRIIEERVLTVDVVSNYHSWLISNTNLEDFEQGVYRPYFWSFALLTTCF